MVTWYQIQYPRIAQPVGSPTDWVVPTFADFFSQWNPLTQQPVRPIDSRQVQPSTFFVGDPDDFGPPVAQVIGWEQPVSQSYPSQPEYRYQLSSIFTPMEPSDFVVPEHLFEWGQPTSQPVLPIDARHIQPSYFVQIEPGDFVVPSVLVIGWEQPISQLVLALEYRYQLQSIFKPDFESIISTPDLVDFSTWVQAINQPVLAEEYRYLLPSIFVWIVEGDFVVSPFLELPLTVTLSDNGVYTVTLTNGGTYTVTLTNDGGYTLVIPDVVIVIGSGYTSGYSEGFE